MLRYFADALDLGRFSEANFSMADLLDTLETMSADAILEPFADTQMLKPKSGMGGAGRAAA
jgi:hypothetical protein